MDSLQTGSMQSCLIIATIAISPLIILLLADSIGRVLRQAKEKAGVDSPGEGGSGVTK
jgi:hypothetical protein